MHATNFNLCYVVDESNCYTEITFLKKRERDGYLHRLYEPVAHNGFFRALPW